MSLTPSIISFDEFMKRDLDYICNSLSEEFALMSGKNLLVTGGAGFLGYYLIQAALHWNSVKDENDAIKVTVYENYVRGAPEWLTDLGGDRNLTLIEQDMIKPLPADIGDFHYIIHAAGIASPIYYRRHPIKTIDANINGLRNLLEYCVRQNEKGCPVEGLLFYSSSEIYGDPSPDMIPTPEDYRGNVSCTGPRACYDESKRFGETLCVNFSNEHDLPVKVARPFNNYGPGLKITDRRVLPDFARDIFTGKDIVMLSDGSPTRTFCYSADAIIGYYKVLVKGHQGEAYNVGIESPEISIAELAEKTVEIARRKFGYTGKVVKQVPEEKEYLIDNPNRRCPIIDKARKHLAYNPSIAVDEGLERALTWYYYNQEAEEA
jgi:UDP-glucuronate decarboxylase